MGKKGNRQNTGNIPTLSEYLEQRAQAVRDSAAFELYHQEAPKTPTLPRTSGNVVAKVDALNVQKPQIIQPVKKKEEGGTLKETSAWDGLSLAEKAEMIGIAVKNGITTLPEIRAKYNEFAEGGSIHIKPSHKGRLTKLKKRTGKTEAELYRTGSPATRKMITFARNVRKFKHALGGPLVENALCPEDKNLYGFGDWLKGAYNKAKSVVNKGREIVRDLGLDKSPAQHVTEKISAIDEKTKNTRYGNNNLGFIERNGLAAAKAIGLDRRYKDAALDTHYRQNLFNMVDPTSAVPSTVEEAVAILKVAEAAKSNRDYKYHRKYQKPTADAAWAKRLGLPYDSTLLIANPDGSVTQRGFLRQNQG